ncbi:Membrane-fusion protein [Vibrio vulnificus]|uniref:Membrane-fusion protein n=1 Tax=Vibrio vulnificus (strain CMCP6) TaxID=216895 RepID=A0A3Q0KZS4_VIBVU|nr:DUF2806 domain-containing protein [Vibrio vulnificus]AAO08055.1 Membrane-fusion protein [Vibrio vulnificus CMCP6]QBN16129.1 DUF2806 domain-containing protein [Vibrio vulnificus]HDY7461716.1 DUF2806 domain-containing protein [Vibrio vulnificus]HDY8161622.1 DUF2806 domain-containing protein [Vibrio vulnificus]
MGWPGEKALMKLGDLVSDGIGGIFAPNQIKRVGKAEVDAKRDEMLMIAQTEQQIADIKAGKLQYTEDRRLIAVDSEANAEQLVEIQKGNRVEPYLNLENLDRQGKTRKQIQAMQEEVNLTKTVLLAEQELESGKYEANDDPVDPDWFTRWRDNAEKVSNDYLQTLWAKVLAGEVTTPGTYSLRTLDLLKSLSKNEAELISKLGEFIIDGRVFQGVIDPRGLGNESDTVEKMMAEKGLNFTKLLYLQEIGIISGVDSMGLTTEYTSLDSSRFVRAFTSKNSGLVARHADPKKKIGFNVLLTSQLGREIFKLADFKTDKEYLKAIAQEVANAGFDVQIGDWQQVDKTSGKLLNPEVIPANNSKQPA